MNPKVKALASTGGLLVVALVCARVAWTNAAEQAGFLELFLKIIAIIFVLTALAAMGCMVWFARASHETLAQPKPRGKSAPGRGTAASEINFTDPTLVAAPPEPDQKSPRSAVKPAPASPRAGAKQPRPAKKAPRPVEKPVE